MDVTEQKTFDGMTNDFQRAADPGDGLPEMRQNSRRKSELAGVRGQVHVQVEFDRSREANAREQMLMKAAFHTRTLGLSFKQSCLAPTPMEQLSCWRADSKVASSAWKLEEGWK